MIAWDIMDFIDLDKVLDEFEEEGKQLEISH